MMMMMGETIRKPVIAGMKAKSSTPATAGTPAVKTPATGIPTKAYSHISTEFYSNQQEN
jgi:hypothetical protein